MAKNVKRSDIGELEITSLNQTCLQDRKLKLSAMDRGTAWLDAKVVLSLVQVSQYVKVIEERQELKIGAIDKVVFRMDYIYQSKLESR